MIVILKDRQDGTTLLTTHKLTHVPMRGESVTFSNELDGGSRQTWIVDNINHDADNGTVVLNIRFLFNEG